MTTQIRSIKADKLELETQREDFILSHFRSQHTHTDVEAALHTLMLLKKSEKVHSALPCRHLPQTATCRHASLLKKDDNKVSELPCHGRYVKLPDTDLRGWPIFLCSSSSVHFIFSTLFHRTERPK